MKFIRNLAAICIIVAFVSTFGMMALGFAVAWWNHR